jgi:polysaccharide export outer membrane protein
MGNLLLRSEDAQVESCAVQWLGSALSKRQVHSKHYSGESMRLVSLNRTLACLLATALSCVALAQLPEPKTTAPKEEDTKTQDLGPATAKTREEAADAVKTPAAVPAMPTAAPVDPNTYVIGPEDILLVRVWREPELSGAVQVRPDGKITLPLIDEVDAAGLTPEALKNKIVEELGEFVNKPEVIVSVQSVQSKKYYITGEVHRTGTFPLVVPVTVLEALTNAGGFREFANLKKITILRKGKVLKFNYTEVIKGKNMEQNILVENGDYIVVR